VSARHNRDNIAPLEAAMPFRRVLVVLLSLVLVGPAAAGAQSARPAADPVVVRAAEPRPADVESAIAWVRSLYFAHDFHHGAAEGDAALERWPESSELAMWTVANLAGQSGGRMAGASRLRMEEATAAEEALARAESLVASRPDDVWTAMALALALTHRGERRGEALDASLRPLGLAPTLPEAVWVRGVVLHDLQQYREVITLIEEKWPVAERQWAELLILAANAHLAMEFEEPKLRSEGIEMLARVREQDPENVNAHLLAGIAQHRLRRGQGAALLERAAVLSPGSTYVAYYHWSAAIYPHPGLESEEKKALINAAARELVERRGQYPGVLREVARWLASLGGGEGLGDLRAEAAALQDRVLAQFPHAVEAELVLADRWQQLYRDLQLGQAQDAIAERAELTSMLWSFIDRPRHHEAALLGQAYYDLFRHLRRDAAVSPDTLLLLARGAMEYNRSLPHAELAMGLAERGVHLDAARQFARDGIDAAEEYAVRSVDLSLTTAATAAVRLDADLAWVYAAIGYVELQAGDLVAARDAMNRALELRPNWPEIQFQTGALAEAEGDVEAAEIHYAWGERYERLDTYSDERPNREALERLLMERGGTMAGYDAFLASIMERDRDRRWQRVADSRIAQPRDLPAMELEWLDGGRITAEELKGRIVVINFWGVWCAPCVAEAPQLQQFHEKYRDDPGVVFLTVNNDDDLGMVRTWMAERKYDFPILLDDNFAAPHGVRSYPTTWFVDANGRIAFEHRGVSTAVFEEFVWRVEMLQAEAADTVTAHADLSAQSNVYTVPLSYNAPGESPGPNFSPIGTRARLGTVAPDRVLPPGAAHPALRAVAEVGPSPESWIPLLLATAAGETGEFNRLYLDMNRNGDFSDDGPAAEAGWYQNEKTGDVTHSFRGVELRVRFTEPERTEPFEVNFWYVMRAGEPEPDTIIRYSRRSWRSGMVTVSGVAALVAAMDANNDALYSSGDSWSIMEASAPRASTRVLSHAEARRTNRLMFLQREGGDDLVLEFHAFAPDGSSITFAVVDYDVSKAEDRLADDMVAEERTRPRATTTYTWLDDLDSAMAAAQTSGRRVFLYFETDWCGPCKTMDEWIWTDAEVVAALEEGFVGVKLDGDIAKEQVRRYEVQGYPNMLIVDPASGSALRSVKGYQSSQQLLEFLRRDGPMP
jgi:thiol-disulfide isomerase/thioredoxin